MKKLNNHVFKGLLISACIKSSWDLVQHLGRGKGGGRLVVRNLGFEVRLQILDSNQALLDTLADVMINLFLSGHHRRFTNCFLHFRTSSFHHSTSLRPRFRHSQYTSRIRLHLLSFSIDRPKSPRRHQRNTNLPRSRGRAN